MWEERLGVSKKDDCQDVNHHDLCLHLIVVPLVPCILAM